MPKLIIKRTDSSSYFPPSFEDMERQALESIPGVSYVGAQQTPPSVGDICLLTNTHTRLSQWSHLRDRVVAILHPNSGYDNLLGELWPEATVVLGNPIRAQAVCEWTLSAFFQHRAQLTHVPEWPKSRDWNRALLAETKTLLIGRGHVGKRLHTQLVALGVPVTVHDPWLGLTADLHQRWSTVILAASLNQENRHLIDRAFLAHQSDDFCLINPARGELVNETDLREYLAAHPRARAYLDVHVTEPYPENYWSLPQVVATPHVAGVWAGLTTAMIQYEAHAVRALVLGEANELPTLKERMTPKGFYR